MSRVCQHKVLHGTQHLLANLYKIVYREYMEMVNLSLSTPCLEREKKWEAK